MNEEERLRIREYAQKLAAEAPPLSPETAHKIAVLLGRQPTAMSGKMKWNRVHQENLLKQRMKEEELLTGDMHVVDLYKDEPCVRCGTLLEKGTFQCWVSKGTYWCGCTESEAEPTSYMKTFQDSCDQLLRDLREDA